MRKPFVLSSFLVALCVGPAMAQQIMVLDDAEVARQLEASGQSGTSVLLGRITDVPVVQAPALEPLATGLQIAQLQAGPLQPVYVGPGVTPPGYRNLNGQAEVRLTERESTINFDFPRGGTRLAGLGPNQ